MRIALLTGALALFSCEVLAAPSAHQSWYAGESLPELRVAAGYSVDVLAESELGERIIDFTFDSSGSLVFTVGAQTRVGCDSYIAQRLSTGEVVPYAQPCIDAPFNIAFNPDEPGWVYFTESEGWWNALYRVPAGGGAGAAELINPSLFVVDSDLAFNSNGILLATEQTSGTLYTDATSSPVVVSTGFSLAPDSYWGYPHLDLFVDDADEMYVVDRYAGEISMVDWDGSKTLLTSEFSSPTSVAITGGILYVGDDTGLYSVEDGVVRPVVVGDVFYELEFGPDGQLYGKTTHRIIRIDGAGTGSSCVAPTVATASTALKDVIASIQNSSAFQAKGNGSLQNMVTNLTALIDGGDTGAILDALIQLRTLVDGTATKGNDQLSGKLAVDLMHALDQMALAVRTAAIAP